MSNLEASVRVKCNGLGAICPANLTSLLLNVVCDNGMPWFEVSGNSYEETYEDVETGGDDPAKLE